MNIRPVCGPMIAALALVGSAAVAQIGEPPAAPDAFAPQLASAGDGALLSWIEPVPGDTGSQRVRFSRWSSGGWSAPTTIVESPALFANWADTPGVASGADGTLVAWWLERLGDSPYAYGVRLARSVDGGANWTSLDWLHDDRSASEHGFVSMVATDDGLRAFWLDGRATPGDKPMTLRTALVGRQVTAEALVDDSVCDCCATAAAFATRPLVAYRDRTNEEIRDIRVARLPSAGEPFSAPVADDGWKIAGCPVNGPALAALDAATVAVAWFTAPDDRSRVSIAFSSDGGASFAGPLRIDEAQPIGRVALAPLAAGNDPSFALAWLARTEAGAELRLLRLAADGRRSVPQVLGATAASRRSGFPRLAAVAGGKLLAVWTETGEGPSRLRVALVDPPPLPPR